ncbi:MAG: hypothetical protein JNL97_09645, partial [Verrucomicrobiales bacterium]|nr:hypothetical protein [Verrucomicrobiales bacterium]
MVLALAVVLASCQSTSSRRSSRPGIKGTLGESSETSVPSEAKPEAKASSSGDKESSTAQGTPTKTDEGGAAAAADKREGESTTAKDRESGAGSGKAPKKPKVRYDSVHDLEIKEVFRKAEENDWEGAERMASELAEANPGDQTLERIYKWVLQQRRLRRDQEVEDKIREIDAKNSVFNPTLPKLLTEKKDRGLPPRKDIRDTVEQIENTPYIPENYGKTIIRKGPMFDIESARGKMANLLEKEVSVHLEDAALETIIFSVGQAEGINFVADKNLPAFKSK